MKFIAAITLALSVATAQAEPHEGILQYAENEMGSRLRNGLVTLDTYNRFQEDIDQARFYHRSSDIIVCSYIQFIYHDYQIKYLPPFQVSVASVN